MEKKVLFLKFDTISTSILNFMNLIDFVKYKLMLKFNNLNI